MIILVSDVNLNYPILQYRDTENLYRFVYKFIGGQPASNAMVTLNQLTTGGTAGQINAATVKRRKKSTGAPNPKKMFEEVCELMLPLCLDQ